MNKIITLDQDCQSIQYLANKDKRLAKLFSMIGPLTYQVTDDSYRFLVEAIIGQMLSNKVADVLASRLSILCHGLITADAINQLSDEQIRSIGISNSKVTYIRNLTKAIENKDLNLASFDRLTDNEVLKQLTHIHGIGNWTAKMYLIFVLDRQDILPYEDMAFIQAYQWLYKVDSLNSKLLTSKCQKWKPYTAIAARYLYQALDQGLTKKEFHLFKK